MNGHQEESIVMKCTAKFKNVYAAGFIATNDSKNSRSVNNYSRVNEKVAGKEGPYLFEFIP